MRGPTRPEELGRAEDTLCDPGKLQISSTNIQRNFKLQSSSLDPPLHSCCTRFDGSGRIAEVIRETGGVMRET
jgi:hypothetical protein